MTTSTLAILILISTMAYFVIARMSRRVGKENSKLIFMSRVLAVFVLVLTAYYFYMRFVA